MLQCVMLKSCCCTEPVVVPYVQESLPSGKAQLNAVMYFDGIQQDSAGYQSVDGGIVLGAFFRKAAREQNDAMRSICSFVEVEVVLQRVECADPVESRGGFVCRRAVGDLFCYCVMYPRRWCCCTATKGLLKTRRDALTCWCT